MFSSPSSLEIKANQDETNDATNKAKKHTAKPIQPFVLLKYDGLPTIENYDEKLELPILPLSLQITDFQPDESDLYIGFWGGHLLRSFRYFAGSPELFFVGAFYLIN